MSSPDELQEYIRENRDMLSRVLACGNEESRAYVLAMLANSEDIDSVEDIQERLDRIKLELS